MTFYFFIIIALFLLTGFAWSLRKRASAPSGQLDLSELENFSRQHSTYFAQITQALKMQDSEYLESRGLPALAKLLQTERREIALQYLANVRQDFQRLLRAARIIALFSPEVSAMQEFERLKLTSQFAWRYQLARMSLKLGHAPLPALRDICDVVGGLSLRLDIAMNDLSERTAANLQLPSSS
jgi:hypothetical protein